MSDLFSEQSLVFCYDLEDAYALSVLFIRLFIFFGHKQPGKCVLFIFVSHICHLWQRLDVVFYALNLFFSSANHLCL